LSTGHKFGPVGNLIIPAFEGIQHFKATTTIDVELHKGVSVKIID